jgi:protein-disulfide isomerase
LEKYAGTVRLVYRDFPLPIHQNAKNAAMAARCAGEQNRYWDMHDQLFAHQEKLDSDSLSQIAQEIGLAMGPYTECFSSKKYEKEIQKDFEDGTQYGVEGTPTFFVNGIMVTGAASLTEFETVIKQAQQK